MNRIFTLVAAALLSSSSFAQLTNMGGPKTYSSKYTDLLKDAPNMIMPEFDLQQQLNEDAINNANKSAPYRFGFEHIVNYSLQSHGIWETLPNGDRVWMIKLTSEDALSINLVFNDFYLPEGAMLHIYNADKSMYDGAYTSINNNENNMLGTQLVQGESAIVEYYEPAEVAGQGRLLIGMVVHGYRDINGWYQEKVNESGACNMDVICPDGAPWADEIRSEARILNGGGLCSGTLVNNTAQDGTPYFLTANHCNPSSMGSAVFRFNYDSPTCGSQTSANSTAPSTNDVVNGSTFRASNADSDFGLVELANVPPVSYNVYYAGWDNSGNTPQTAVGIHHPIGDVKKISFDDDVLQSAQGLSSIANSEWRIEAWERNTTTEGGSSGSGLWDENHHIVGQLHGGQASCSNSINDYYGKFSMSWGGNGSTSSSQRLQDWLDPQGSGVTSLDGWDPNGSTIADDAGIITITEPTTSSSFCNGYFVPVVTLKNYGTSTLTSVTISYNVDGGTNQTYNWTGSLSSGATEDVTLGGISVTTDGTHSFTVTTSLPNGTTDGNTVNDDATVSFSAYTNAQELFVNIMTDCWGSETSWEITTQGSSTVLWSAAAGDYGDVTGGETISTSICLTNDCYTFTINDEYGDGMNGSQYSSCTVDGDYNITAYYGTQYVAMTATNADFGSTTSHDFCINDVSINENEEFTFGLFPNPASSEVTLVALEEGVNFSGEIIIHDMQGRIVRSFDNVSLSKGNNFTIGLEDYVSGVYFVTIQNNNDLQVVKLIVK